MSNSKVKLGELVEQLTFANTKLYFLCEKKTTIVENPASFCKQELVDLLREDVNLCRERETLKTAINSEVYRNVDC